jgi:hypothetical protein
MENIPALNFSTTLPITSIESSFGKSPPFSLNYIRAARSAPRVERPRRNRFNKLPAVAALTTTTAATTVATTRSTIFLRAGFVDVDGAAIQVTTVQLGNRTIAFRVVAHFDESEPSGLASVPIRNDADAINGPIGFK